MILSVAQGASRRREEWRINILPRTEEVMRRHCAGSRQDARIEKMPEMHFRAEIPWRRRGAKPSQWSGSHCFQQRSRDRRLARGIG